MFVPELNSLIRTAVPAWLIPVFIAITTLGGVGFFFVVLTLQYWLREHERGAVLISLALGGLAIIVALKSFFAVPRPPEAIRHVSVSSFRFPSGHATLSTVVYGSLAYYLDVGSRETRILGAAILIFLVSLSRVVLGVHYVQDVIAGVLVGILFLVGAIRVVDHDPRSGFWVAFGLASGAAITSGASQDGLSVHGASVAAVLSWEVSDPVSTVPSLKESVIVVFVASYTHWRSVPEYPRVAHPANCIHSHYSVSCSRHIDASSIATLSKANRRP